jgi:hypothetical protein
VSVEYILSSVSMLCVCLGDCGLPLTLFQVEFRVLFSLHHVNQGGVHVDQVWELFLVLLPPRERSVSLTTCCTRMYAFCSVSPLTEDGSTSIDVLLTPKRSSKTLTLGTCRSS